MARARARVTGVGGVLKGLEVFDKDLAKATAKTITKAGKDIATDAKAAIPDRPLRNWRDTPARFPRGKRNRDGTLSRVLSRGGAGWPAWAPAKARSSIKSRRRDITLTITLNEASANIYALAGTKNTGMSPQGVAFINSLPLLSKSSGRGGRSGRVMVPAVRKHYPQIIATIDNEVFRVVKEVNRKV